MFNSNITFTLCYATFTLSLVISLTTSFSLCYEKSNTSMFTSTMSFTLRYATLTLRLVTSLNISFGLYYEKLTFCNIDLTMYILIQIIQLVRL